MNGWQLLNWLAWGLSALMLGLMALDFARVERERASRKGE
jgi:hypothetical protein